MYLRNKLGIALLSLAVVGLSVLSGCDSGGGKADGSNAASNNSTAGNSAGAGGGQSDDSKKPNDANSEAGNQDLAGTITLDGSSTVYPISEAAAANFKKKYPNVRVTVGKSGTGGGFKRFTVGETDISNASRPISLNEIDACVKNQVKFVELPVAYDGLSLVVHPSNDFIKQLTLDQIKLIFLSNQQLAMKWSDIDASWPDKPIKIFSPGTDSGTFDYFKEVVAGKVGSLRGDMSTSEDDSVLVNGVAGDPNAIGFFGAAYYFQNKDKLKVLKIVNPQTQEAVEPTPETIENGQYAPFSRPLFIYLNAAALDKPQVDEFADFYLQSAGELATTVGYVPLPKAVYNHAIENLQGGVSGTHYWTKDREQRHGKVTDIFSATNLTDF